MDYYLTIGENAIVEFVEKKSRFISEIRKTVTEAEAQSFIAERKKAFWNATHNVFAYTIRENLIQSGGIKRYSDDGEPSGTAGMPTLEVLTGRQLEDCTVVTTRYFGGTLLGTGGLVRAYSKGAALAVEKAGIIKMQLCAHMLIACDYSSYGRLQGLIPENGGVLIDTRFTDVVTICFYLPRNCVDYLQAQIIEISAGALKAEIIGEAFEAVKN